MRMMMMNLFMIFFNLRYIEVLSVLNYKGWSPLSDTDHLRNLVWSSRYISSSSSSSSSLVNQPLNIGLSQFLPQLPILSYSFTFFSCKIFYSIFPSSVGPLSAPFIVIWVPVCNSFSSSIVIHPCYVFCPSPFLFCNYLYNVFHSSLGPYLCWPTSISHGYP